MSSCASRRREICTGISSRPRGGRSMPLISATSGAIAMLRPPNATALEYSATISWGDGTPTSTGAITLPTGGPFTVTGSHTYTEERSYTVTVTITDVDNAGHPTTTTSTARVADAPLTISGIAAGSQGRQAAAGVTFS